jgi:exonuclease VII small subunit
MFENEGTTPAQQDSTTPAQQDSTTPSTTEQYLTLAELQAKVANLEAQLDTITTSRDYWMNSYGEMQKKLSRAEQAFKDILSGDTEASDIVDSYGAVLNEHLGWEFTKEVEIELTVTYRGTIELPFGTDVDDLDASDFSVEGYIGHDHLNADLTHWNSEVEER